MRKLVTLISVIAIMTSCSKDQTLCIDWSLCYTGDNFYTECYMNQEYIDYLSGLCKGNYDARKCMCDQLSEQIW